jgi:hypothetical protein
VRDAATGVVLAISTDGEATLGSTPGEVEVVLSDGVHSQVVRVRRQ